MSPDERPVVVAFDGSGESEAAVRQAAALFADRTRRPRAGVAAIAPLL